MTVFRSNWLIEIGTIQREMDRLLDHYAGSKPPLMQFAKRAWEPAVDVYETPENIVIAAELAGIEEDSLEIIGDRSTFIIRGYRIDTGAGIKRSYHQIEIISGPFERVIPLSVAVDVQQAKAQYQTGVLQITVPKSEGIVATKTYVRIVRGGRSTNG